ncbi:hypothetical protein ACWC5I_05420 [Kitasatospora sp. NPDC001574]
MRQFIVMLAAVRAVLRPGGGQRRKAGASSRVRRRMVRRRGVSGVAARSEVRVPVAGSYCAPWAVGPSPAEVWREMWAADLEEMGRQFERREALRAACEGLPDPGYSYPGAQSWGVA